MGYKLDKHYDEMEDFLRINKDSRILDVAAGTGLSGQKVMRNCELFQTTCITELRDVKNILTTVLLDTVYPEIPVQVLTLIE